MAIHVCNDDPNRILGNEIARAEYTKPGQDATDLRLPAGAAVASRVSNTQAIEVQRVTFGEKGQPAQVENQAPVDLSTVVHEGSRPKVVPSEMHRDASLDFGAEAQGITVPSAEHGIGVQPTKRAVVSPSDALAVADADTAVVSVDVTPAPPQVPPVQLEPKLAGDPAVVAIPASPSPAKVRVTLSSNKMGRHRVRVDKLAISDSVVVLGYIDDDDDDAVIVEPPISEGNADTITVTAENQTVTCVYYGMTAEMVIDNRPMLLVVLVRTDV